TIPVALAAARMRIPIVCHESDANPGLAIRFIAKFAKVVCTAYPAKVYTQLPRRRIVHTGQPVRDIFYIQAKSLPSIEGEALDPKKPLISVVCGSQGSRRVNQLVSEVWEKLLDDFQIVHVTGPHEHALYAEKRKQLSKFQKSRLHVVSFLTDELPALYQKSAVVISRSGGSIAELAASRACSILIPLSTAAQNHQWANARVVVGAGAGVALDETTATPQELEKLIRELMSDEREQTGLRAAIGHFDYPDAALRMADLLLDA
ncbi:MAG: glycosyltransferase, partial [Candidatus Paceibacterota bacterium]